MRWISDKAQKFLEHECRLQKSERWRAYLLDSSLITATLPKMYYNCRVIDCGDFVQVFAKDRDILINSSSSLEKFKTDTRSEVQTILKSIPGIKKKIKKDIELKEISEKNVLRAKNNLCRLILANNDKFKTFITLTYNYDISDLRNSNKELHKFLSKVKRVYKDFMYICVPEFTKKNRIHYHLITNIDYNNNILIEENILLNKFYNKINKKSIVLKKVNFVSNNINKKMNDFDICLRFDKKGRVHNTKQSYSYKTKKKVIFKTIKYWNNGFTNVMELDNICNGNIVGYMSKYMTKDMDDRLFGFRKYTYSMNLIQPKVQYLDLTKDIDNLLLDVNYLSLEKKIRYENSYTNVFGDRIYFIEFEKLT